MIKASWLWAPIILLSACGALEWNSARIDEEADRTLRLFREEVSDSDIFLGQASAYLVFPRVIKAGIGVGAETGEGVLRINGQTTGYYRTTSGSIGFQAGAQAKSIIIAFLTQSSLEAFLKSSGWRVGIDGSIALIDVGIGKTIDTDNVRDPVVGFVFASRGLMYNLTFEGARITRLQK